MVHMDYFPHERVGDYFPHERAQDYFPHERVQDYVYMKLAKACSSK